MDEQRTQAYINLIEQLLTCANGEEPNILQANQELIDPQFLQVMENYATGLEEQGNNIDILAAVKRTAIPHHATFLEWSLNGVDASPKNA